MIEGPGDSPQYALEHLDPSRIRKAREREGLTRKDLAVKVEKTPSAISQFESGVTRPDLSTLIRLGMALQLPTLYFAKPKRERSNTSEIAFDTCHFRARRSVSQKARRASVRLGEDVIEVAQYLEKQGINFPAETLTSFMATRDEILDRHSDIGEAIEHVAVALRAHWGLGLGPIPNLVQLLESQGVFVLPLAEVHADVDAYSTWVGGRPCMMLALNKSAAHARFDAGHELGHLVLHDDTHQVGEHEVEQQAHRFSGAFNAPRESFYAECPRGWSLAAFLQLKERWKLSIGALVRRGKDIGRLTDSSYRRAYRDLSRAGYRKMEPLDAETPHERPVLLDQALGLLKGEVSLELLAIELRTSMSRVSETLRHIVSAKTLNELRKASAPAAPLRLVTLSRDGADEDGCCTSAERS